MGVIHILKDGTRLDDITGHVVKLEDAEPLYQFLSTLNRQTNISSKRNTYKKEKSRRSIING